MPKKYIQADPQTLSQRKYYHYLRYKPSKEKKWGRYACLYMYSPWENSKGILRSREATPEEIEKHELCPRCNKQYQKDVKRGIIYG